MQSKRSCRSPVQRTKYTALAISYEANPALQTKTRTSSEVSGVGKKNGAAHDDRALDDV